MLSRGYTGTMPGSATGAGAAAATWAAAPRPARAALAAAVLR